MTVMTISDVGATRSVTFSNVTIGLTPLIFAMHYRPSDAQTPVVFAIGSQLEFALAGLLVSVVVLGFVLSRFIIRQPAHA